MTVNKELSEKFANLVGAEEGRCTRNCARLILEHAGELPEGAEYIEGAWNPNSQAEPHAWIETPRDGIIDPTWAVLPPSSFRHWGTRENIPRQRVRAFNPHEVRCHVEKHRLDAEDGWPRYPILERGDPLVDHAEHIVDPWNCSCSEAIKHYFRK